MKTYAVTDTDFDGLTCAWLLEKFNDQIIIIPEPSRGSINEWKGKIEDASFVYFADLCPKPEDLKSLLQNGIDFKVIDHHETSRRKIEKYDKENGTNLMSKCVFEVGEKVRYESQNLEEEVTRDAALSLVWKEFTDNAPLPPALQYLNAFDTYTWWTAEDSEKLSKAWGKLYFPQMWDKEKTYGENMQAKLQAGRKNVKELLDKVLKVKTGPDGVDLSDIDYNLENFVKENMEDFEKGIPELQKVKDICERAKRDLSVMTIDGMDFLAVNQDTDKDFLWSYSAIGGSVADMSPNEVSVSYKNFKIENTPVVKFSMRSRSRTSDKDIPAYSLTPLSEKMFCSYVVKNKDGEDERITKTGGGHGGAGSFSLNINEEDRVSPDQVMASDLLSTLRPATDEDIVCDISPKTSSLRLSSRDKDKIGKYSSIRLSSRDAVEDTIKYWDKAKNKDFSKYYRLLKKNKKKANYIPNPKSTMQNPIKKNYDYGESPNWIDRVKNRQKSRKKRKGSINSILK